MIKRLSKLSTIHLCSPTLTIVMLLQNRAARIITWADYSIRSSDVLNSLEWSNVEERRKRHLLVTMFKIFNDCPTYLIWGVLTMISNYHYLKQIFSSAHFLIGVQWLGTNCQMKHVRWGILLALNSPYLRIQLLSCFYLISNTYLLLLFCIVS